MKLLKVQQHKPDQAVLMRAAKILINGGVVIHPTETVYGLAAIYDLPETLERVIQLKRRSPASPFSLMVDSVAKIVRISGCDDPVLREFMHSVFPGPVTILVHRVRAIGLAYWDQFEYLGFRIPQHPLSLRLVQLTGKPLITTSANLSGQAPPRSREEIAQEVLEGADLVLDGGECRFKVPSTIVRLDKTLRQITILREGAYPVVELKRKFRAAMEGKKQDT